MQKISKTLFLLLFSFSYLIAAASDNYTINFNNVPMVEYIRFASRVCGNNFLFDDNELNFQVSVVSKEEITPDNVMATLIQILRIHGLSLLEQDGNLVIHKNPEVKQIAKIVTDTNKDDKAPIVTRVFTIRNVKIESVANIIRPMISAEALLEVLLENSQLIITDINANIQKIAELVEIIDSPQNPLVIETYKVQENDPDYLIPLANQIMTPLAEGNPFILVPQVLNGRIYIVSTPKLTEKALGVLASLDSPIKDEIKKNMKSGQVFIYSPIYRNKYEVERALNDIADSLKDSGYSETGLIDVITSRKWIKDTGSFLFAGSPETIVKLTEILNKIDGADTKKAEENFFTYKPKNTSIQELIAAIKEISGNLKKSEMVDSHLLKVLDSAKEVDANQSLMFTGDSSFFKKIKEILASVDEPPSSEALAKGKYFLYKLKNVSGAVIEEDLDNFIDKLKAQKIKNPQLIHTLENIRWIKETNSLLITGSEKTIDEAKQIIAEYDIARGSNGGPSDNFFIYKPQFVSPQYIEKSLKDIAKSLEKARLSDPSLLASIKGLKYVDTTNSLAFTGSKTTIEKIKNLLSTIDVPSAMSVKGDKKGKPTYFLYQIKKAPYQQLTASIRAFANDLKNTAVDPDFIEALNSMKYKSETNSLLFTGAPEDLEKVKAIIERFDVPSLGETIPEYSGAFFVYKPKYLSGPALESVLREFSDHLKTTGFTDQSLFNTIQNMRWVEKNNSLIFSGDTKSIEEVKQILATFDVPGQTESSPADSIQSIEEDTSFLVYKLQYHKGSEIQNALKQIAKELIKNESKTKRELVDAINSLQWIQITNSLLSTGSPSVMGKLKELISSLDIPLKQVFIEVLVVDTTLTNMLNFGLDWGSKFKFKNRFSAGTSNSPYSNSNSLDTFTQNLGNISESNTPTGSSIPFVDGFDLGVIGDIIMHKGKSFLSLGSFIQALQTDDESSVVMTPKILSQDGKTSTIFIGTNIPYLGSQTDIVGGATSSTTQNLEYRDVGMDLSITPMLGNGDVVTLDIDLKRSAVDSNSSSSTVSGITTSKTAMQTTVHIPNKNFLVLSGMVTDTKTKKREGLPCLGGLPWIGAAFSKNNNLEDKRNVVIFIRPHIINSYQDMVALTESQEDYFKEKSGSPILEQELDEAAEMIKSLGE